MLERSALEEVARLVSLLDAPGSQPAYQATEPGMQMRVSIAPTKDITLRSDLDYVKAALLYADSTTLCSPTAAVISTAYRIANASSKEQQDILDSARSSDFAVENDSLAVAMVLAQFFQSFSSKVHRTQPPLPYIDFDETSPDVQELVRILENPEDLGIFELALPISTGLLTLVEFPDYWNRSKTSEVFMENLLDSWAHPVATPLLDRSSSKWLGQAIKKVSRTGVPGGLLKTHGTLAASLFDRMPSFQDLTLGQTLELRYALQDYLIPFRAELLLISEKFQHELWEDSLASEIEFAFHTKVLPEIVAIERKLGEHRLTASLMRAMISSDSATSSFLGLSMAAAGIAAPLTSAALGGLGVMRSINEESKERRKSESEAITNPMYFYYKAWADL